MYVSNGRALQRQLFPKGEPESRMLRRGNGISQIHVASVLPNSLSGILLPQITMDQEVHLRVSLLLMVEDPAVQIHHLLLLEACVLTLPEGMPLPGVQREAGAAITFTVQCVSKVRMPTKYHASR